MRLGHQPDDLVDHHGVRRPAREATQATHPHRCPDTGSMLTCGARTPVDCTAGAVQHVQLHEREGHRFGELALCEAHFDELEPEYRRDWHPLGKWCAYPWRTWDHDSRQCVANGGVGDAD